ncbi:MAG: DNA methyltransferase [Pseudomonadota bacterium]
MTSLVLKSGTAPVADLAPYPNNPRTHTTKQIRQIARSIERFGWTNPILIDAENGVIAGHGRLEAAKLLGMFEVPVLRLDHMSPAEKRAYVIADNKLAENAGWDDALLAAELQGLFDLDINFDLELTGFETGEIDIILGNDVAPEEEPVPGPDFEAPAVNRQGDLWLIGQHCLICGDCLDRKTWTELLDNEKAQMVFTDPPYNVRVDGHISGLGQKRHREFAMASGEMSAADFTAFLRNTFRYLSEFSEDGSIHFVCMDWRHMPEVLAASDGIYSELKNLCVWAKSNAGMGSFYRSQHELVFAFKNGAEAHINNFGLGSNGRHRSNVWEYAGANTFREGRMEDLQAHPTVKPLQMVADAILDCSKRGGLIVDAFTGSGTTLLAAARTGRIGAGVEIDPHYADLALRRLEAETGETAVHADTLESFAEMARLRNGEQEDG